MNTKITCDSCGGEAILKYRDITLNDNKIIIKDEPYYECQKCKDCFVTNEQMKKLDKRIHESFIFKRNVIVAGKSLAVTLPADVVDYYKIKKGNKVSILTDSKSIRIYFD